MTKQPVAMQSQHKTHGQLNTLKPTNKNQQPNNIKKNKKKIKTQQKGGVRHTRNLENTT